MADNLIFCQYLNNAKHTHTQAHSGYGSVYIPVRISHKNDMMKQCDAFDCLKGFVKFGIDAKKSSGNHKSDLQRLKILILNINDR